MSKPSRATELVALAEDTGLEVFHTKTGEPYADVPVAGHRETRSLRQRAMREYLAQLYFSARGETPGASAVRDAVEVLAGKAQFTGPEREVATRVGAHDGAIYLDLCNERWEAIEITATGWRIVPTPPVRFKRAMGMLGLPMPVAGTRLDKSLGAFLNATGSDLTLIIGWLVGALRPAGPHAALALYGAPGTGKSVAGETLRRILDPNAAALRAEPKEPRDLAIAASNGWFVALDNLSSIPPWLSDTLCGLATGRAFATRSLYTDDEEVLFSAVRPILLTAIEEVCIRGDLVDRSVVVELSAIERRRTEREYWEDFEAARPTILGGLLDAAVSALAGVADAPVDPGHRMADFLSWVHAAEPGLGWREGRFADAYGVNREDVNAVPLEAAMFVPALHKLLDEAPKHVWEGEAQALLARLTEDETIGRTTLRS